MPENVLDAGLVVAILVHGKGPVLFDAGRAAQSMLLAAWAEGTRLVPERDRRRRPRPPSARRRGRGDPGDRPLVRSPERAARPARAHGVGMEREGESQAARRGRAMAAVSRMRGGLDLGGTKIQAVVTDGAATVLGSATAGDAAPGWSGRRGARARRGAAGGARRRGRRADGARRRSASALRARSTATTGTVGQVANIDGWERPFPLGPTLADRVRAAGDGRQRRQRRGRGRAAVRSRSGLRLVPRRVLGHRCRRRHRDGRQAARRPRVGRRDRARVLEARWAPLQLRSRWAASRPTRAGARSKSAPASSRRSARRSCSS